MDLKKAMNGLEISDIPEESMLQNRGENAVKNIWSEAIPLKEVNNIKEFADWISDRPANDNQTAE